MKAQHPIRGFLIGPVVVPIAYWIGGVAYVWVRDSRLDWFHALRELMIIVLFGLPLAYAAAAVVAVPVLYILYRLRWLRAVTVMATGALGGMLVAAWFSFEQQGSLFRVYMPVPLGTMLGALAGGAGWWAGQGDARRKGT